MTPKVFVSLGALAALSLVAAGAVHNVSALWAPVESGGSYVLPGLKEKADEIAGLHIVQGDRELMIDRDGDNWLLENRGGFPADPGKVRANIVGLSELRLFEPKTSKPELYEKLELEDPSSEGAKSNLVEVLDASGAPLARLIVGKKRRGVERQTQDGIYVRLDGEDRAWLAAGASNLKVDLDAWLDTRVMDLAVQDIDRISVTRGVSFPVKLERAQGDNGGFELIETPEGMTAKSQFALQNEVRKMTQVRFDDVRTAEPAGEPLATMLIEGSSGLRVTFELRRAGEGNWVRISARGEGTASDCAQEINARYARWEIHLEDRGADDFTLTLADVIDPEAG